MRGERYEKGLKGRIPKEAVEMPNYQVKVDLIIVMARKSTLRLEQIFLKSKHRILIDNKSTRNASQKSSPNLPRLGVVTSWPMFKIGQGSLPNKFLVGRKDTAPHFALYA